MNGVLDKSIVTVKTISNAGHFSFISPFPATMTNPNFLPSIDPVGFNREKFHQELPAMILTLLNEKFYWPSFVN